MWIISLADSQAWETTPAPLARPSLLQEERWYKVLVSYGLVQAINIGCRAVHLTAPLLPVHSVYELLIFLFFFVVVVAVVVLLVVAGFILFIMI